MIEKIDEFKKTSFVKGLIVDTNNETMKNYNSDISDIESEIEDIICDDVELNEKYRKYMEEYYLLNNKKDSIGNEER
mgnify:CR=1 FL=1